MREKPSNEIPEAVDSALENTRSALNEAIKQLETVQEEIRAKRQLTKTQFQNFDHKANQLFNLLVQVAKTMNEMRSASIKSML